MISIHAPHEGERHRNWMTSSRRIGFQSTLPTRGSDVAAKRVSLSISGFQSTLPTRGSDVHGLRNSAGRRHFNPRSPRGGATVDINDLAARISFQSTLPTRGSNAELLLHRRRGRGISIHAPHEGEQQPMREQRRKPKNFNPRSPRGGATIWYKMWCIISVDISIHAPHEGEQLMAKSTIRANIQFQSTLPTRGSNDYRGGLDRPLIIFQSTLPTRGSNGQGIKYPYAGLIDFNPRSPRGGATSKGDKPEGS